MNTEKKNTKLKRIYETEKKKNVSKILRIWESIFLISNSIMFKYRPSVSRQGIIQEGVKHWPKKIVSQIL